MGSDASVCGHLLFSAAEGPERGLGFSWPNRHLFFFFFFLFPRKESPGN